MLKRIVKKYSDSLILLLLMVVYVLFQWRYINIDFWNDEIFTLKNFVFTSIGTTVTDYPVPNNHVFFSLISNIYLKIIGVGNLSELMDSPYKIRVLTLLFSILTILCVYKTAKEIFNKKAALISVIVLITTIPFYQFALQIRGYGLSTLMVTVILYLLALYINRGKAIFLVGISVAIGLLIYVMPSNLYFILGLIVFFFTLLFFSLIKKNLFEKLNVKKILFLLFSFFIGSLLALGFYAPIFSNVFLNSYVDNYSVEGENQLLIFVPQVLDAFLSFRWGLLLLFIIGIFFSFKEDNTRRLFLLLFLSLFILPFVFSYIRNDHPPVRIYQYLLPVFCLPVSIGIYSILKKLIKSSFIEWLMLLVLLTYTSVVLGMEFKKIDSTMLEKIQLSEKMQDLKYQYYLSYYHPYKNLDEFKKTNYSTRNLPVLIGAEPHDMPDYLKKFQLWYLGENFLDSLITANDSAYVISNFPEKIKNNLDYEITLLNKEPSYYNFFKCKKNNELYKEIVLTISDLNNKYGDSVYFVFNFPEAYMVKDMSNIKKAYIINQKYQKKAGELIQFINEKEYICYFEALHANVPNMKSIYHILYNEHPVIINTLSYEKYSLRILKKSEIKDTALQYYNNFETESAFWTKSNFIEKSISFSGNKSEKLSANNQYSSTFSCAFQDLNINGKVSFVISCRAKFEKDKSAYVVIEVTRNGNNYLWQGIDMNDYYTGKGDWENIIATYTPEKELQKDDLIKIYIWNKENNVLWLDDLKVKIDK